MARTASETIRESSPSENVEPDGRPESADSAAELELELDDLAEALELDDELLRFVAKTGC